MKFNQIFCALFVLIVFYLTLFVSASTIQRSLSDDIRNGISIAGKILGNNYEKVYDKIKKKIVKKNMFE